MNFNQVKRQLRKMSRDDAAKANGVKDYDITRFLYKHGYSVTDIRDEWRLRLMQRANCFDLERLALHFNCTSNTVENIMRRGGLL